MRVIAQGRLKQRSYETREGEKRTVIELDVDEVGPSLKYASAKVNRTQRGSSTGGGFGGSGADAGASDDPWGSAPPAGGSAGASGPGGGGPGGGYSEEPPF
jgi:single-strand DNA-binding protein